MVGRKKFQCHVRICLGIADSIESNASILMMAYTIQIGSNFFLSWIYMHFKSCVIIQWNISISDVRDFLSKAKKYKYVDENTLLHKHLGLFYLAYFLKEKKKQFPFIDKVTIVKQLVS